MQDEPLLINKNLHTKTIKMPNKKQDLKATKGNMAAQYRGSGNMAKQKAKVNASKNKARSTASPSSNPTPKPTVKDVFKPIKGDNTINVNLLQQPKGTLAASDPPKEQTFAHASLKKGHYAAKMDHAAKLSDTDKGIEYRYGKQATSDALAAQQKGNPILKDIEKAKSSTKPAEHHTSGMPKFITSAESGEKMSTQGLDEGNFSKITTNIPERSKVTATEDSDKYQKGEEFYVDPAKMHAKHPSMKRMEEMVSKVATYNMPNVKAAQKKYHK